MGFIRKRKEKRRREEHQALRAAHPLNGHCPVIERDGDGCRAGLCQHALRGQFCPRHGSLAGLLVPAGSGRGWKAIDEDQLPWRDQREMAPDGVFRSAP
jgi:hypothetical protein